jgi:hypothetical protein
MISISGPKKMKIMKNEDSDKPLRLTLGSGIP